MNAQNVIVFDNLRQRTAVIGQYDTVTVMSKSFVSTNAHGLLHEVNDLSEIVDLATQAGKRVKALLSVEE